MSVFPFKISYSSMSPDEEDVYIPVKTEDLFYAVTKK